MDLPPASPPKKETGKVHARPRQNPRFDDKVAAEQRGKTVKTVSIAFHSYARWIYSRGTGYALKRLKQYRLLTEGNTERAWYRNETSFGEKTQTATHFAQRTVLYLESTKYFLAFFLSFSFFFFSFSFSFCLVNVSCVIFVVPSFDVNKVTNLWLQIVHFLNVKYVNDGNRNTLPLLW